MIQTSYSEAREHLAGLLDRVAADHEKVIIKRRGRADVALIAADELESLEETAHLLRSPENARRFLQGLLQAERGPGVEVDEADLEALEREVSQLETGGGGTSPTLDRLMRIARGPSAAHG